MVELKRQFKELQTKSSRDVASALKKVEELSEQLKKQDVEVSKARTMAETAGSAAPFMQAKTALLDRTKTMSDKKMLVATDVGMQALLEVYTEETKKKDDDKDYSLLEVFRQLMLTMDKKMIFKDPSQADLVFVEREAAKKKMEGGEDAYSAKKRANLALEKLGRFDGSAGKWDRFIMLFNSAIRNADYGEMELRTAFLGQMEGLALDFYQGSESLLRDATFSELVNAFEKEFSQFSTTRALWVLQTLKQLPSENVSSFATRIKICTKIFLQKNAPSHRIVIKGGEKVLIPNPLLLEESFAHVAVQSILDMMHVFYFFHGVRPEIQLRFSKVEYDSLDECLQEAKNNEALIEMLTPKRMINSLHERLNMPGPHSREEIEQEADETSVHFMGKPRGKRMGQSPYRGKVGGKSPFEGECWNCGKVGHMRSECRSKPQGSQYQGQKKGTSKVPFSRSKSPKHEVHAVKGKKSQQKKKRVSRKQRKAAVHALTEALMSTDDEGSSSNDETESDDSKNE